MEIKDWRRKLKNRAAAARSRDLKERRLQEQLQNEERGIQEIEDGIAALRQRGIQEIEDGIAALRPVGNDNDA